MQTIKKNFFLPCRLPFKCVRLIFIASLTLISILSSLQLIKQYLNEKNIVIQSSESLHCYIEFAEDRITLDLPNGELVSGNWKLKSDVHPVEVRYISL